MEVLLTFTGFHDPFSKGLIDQEEQPGPILSLLSVRKFDCVYLFDTPNTSELTQETRKAISRLYGGAISGGIRRRAAGRKPRKPYQGYMGISRWRLSGRISTIPRIIRQFSNPSEIMFRRFWKHMNTPVTMLLWRQALLKCTPVGFF